MNSAYLHLIMNHFPVIGVIIGMLTLLAGLFMSNTIVKRTALSILIFSAVSAIPVYLSGEGAEDVVEKIAAVNEANVEDHEEEATVFAWVIGFLGLFSAITLFMDIKGRPYSRFYYLVTAGLAIAAIIPARMAGNSGGNIRHTEITDMVPEKPLGGVEEGEEVEEVEDGEDDEDDEDDE